MKSIQVTTADGKIQQFACNNDGSGVFVLRGGAYQQIAGNGQTPHFGTPAALRRWLGSNRDDVVAMVRGSAIGWD